MPVKSSAPPKSELKRLYEQHNGNVLQIARKLKRAGPTVQHWYRQIGLSGKGTGGVESTAPPESELRELYERHGGVISQIALEMRCNASTVQNWYHRIGMRGTGHSIADYNSVYPQQINEKLNDGYVVAASDFHFWFKEKSRAHEALLVALKRLKPAIFIANGDVLDGARISRHDPSGVDPLPSFADEVFITQRHMAEIARACGTAKRYWTLGNHSTRFSRYLAKNAPDMEGLDGMRLDHHFPGWQFCMSVLINDDLFVKHAPNKGGIHATRNTALNDGRTTVFGHLHSQKSAPITDARGTRWGVDSGTMAEPAWPQFNYTLNDTKDWRSGFVCMEIRGGKLLPPMLATVLDDGQVILQRNEKLL